MTRTDFGSTAIDRFLTGMRLKDMDATLLSRAILVEAGSAGLNVNLINEAALFASYVHRGDIRQQRGSMPLVHYIEHPLRNTLRLLRYGITDEAVLVASLLHDTVEDHPEEIAADFAGIVTSDTSRARAITLGYLEDEFGADVARIVRAVTNPLMPAGISRDQKHVLYRSHVAEAIADPQAALVKFSDFVDNAGSLLHHADIPAAAGMVPRLAKKYGPLLDVFERRFNQDDLTGWLRSHGREGVAEHLRSTRDVIDRILA